MKQEFWYYMIKRVSLHASCLNASSNKRLKGPRTSKRGQTLEGEPHFLVFEDFKSELNWTFFSFQGKWSVCVKLHTCKYKNPKKQKTKLFCWWSNFTVLGLTCEEEYFKGYTDGCDVSIIYCT